MFGEVGVLASGPRANSAAKLTSMGVPSCRHLNNYNQVSIAKRLLCFGIGISETQTQSIFDLLGCIICGIRRELRTQMGNRGCHLPLPRADRGALR